MLFFYYKESRPLSRTPGQEALLTSNKYELLKVPAEHTGKVLTHKHLPVEVWGQQYRDEFHMLRVNISNLGRRLETDPARPQFIFTEYGLGYRLKAD
jgi:two-component system KDP operon response regulator KdpE